MNGWLVEAVSVWNIQWGVILVVYNSRVATLRQEQILMRCSTPSAVKDNYYSVSTTYQRGNRPHKFLNELIILSCWEQYRTSVGSQQIPQNPCVAGVQTSNLPFRGSGLRPYFSCNPHHNRLRRLFEELRTPRRVDSRNSRHRFRFINCRKRGGGAEVCPQVSFTSFRYSGARRVVFIPRESEVNRAGMNYSWRINSFGLLFWQ